jgi:hypothetical protein
MLVDIESRFRAGEIGNSDCDALKTIILASTDESELESALYIFGRSCRFDPEVLAVCEKYFLEQPAPGLTAVCMRTAFDYWGLWESYRGVLARYLDAKLYDEWYDEVLFACRFCTKLTVDHDTDFFAAKLMTLLDAARREGHFELLKLATVDTR